MRYVGRIVAVAGAALALAPSAAGDPTLASRISDLAGVPTYCWSDWSASDVPDSGGYFRPADATIHLPRSTCRPIGRQLRRGTPRDPNAWIAFGGALFTLAHERAHADQYATGATLDERDADCRGARAWRGLARRAGVSPAIRRWLVRELRGGMGYDRGETKWCW